MFAWLQKGRDHCFLSITKKGGIRITTSQPNNWANQRINLNQSLQTFCEEVIKARDEIRNVQSFLGAHSLSDAKRLGRIELLRKNPVLFVFVPHEPASTRKKVGKKRSANAKKKRAAEAQKQERDIQKLGYPPKSRFKPRRR